MTTGPIDELAVPSLLSLALVGSGCCFVPGPAPVATSAAPEAPTLDEGSWAVPAATASDLEIDDPFTALAGATPQVPEPRALFETATPTTGDAHDTVLVCTATLLGGGFDDSLFAGGADVYLAMRIGEGELRNAPQTSERTYSFPVASLTHGQTVWVRVLDRDVVFDDTIAEGTTTYAGTPLRLTMGQANVECRALDPALVAARRTTALTALEARLPLLPTPEPDLAADDLGFPSASTSSVASAIDGLAAWSVPADPALVAARERGHAWFRSWSEAAERAVSLAVATLPPPGTSVADGSARITVVREACGAEATTLRAEIGDAAASTAPSTGCLVRLRLEQHGPVTLDPLGSADTWSIGADARRDPTPILAARTGDAWRAVGPGPTSLAGDFEVVFVLAGEQHAPLLRLGPPFAHAQLLRLR